jgi:two-component system, cell cycle response regulator
MVRERETAITVITDSFGHRVDDGVGQACLVVFYGQNIGKRFFLDRTELIIGRSERSDIQVDQESVSRQHAKLVTQQHTARVYDLDSTNGTYVNDKLVHDIELRDGDLIRIGQTIFKYLSGTNIESKYHEEIYRLTTIDGLTQAYNKRFFTEALDRELNRALRYGRMLSLVMFDIDHFKPINDQHGHLAGDYVLRDLASIVHGNIRRQDVFARYGGEEFSLILPEIEPEGARLVCEKIRVLVETHTFVFDHEQIAVTISLGIRSVREGDTGIDSTRFLAEADAKLYEAKQTGRNRVCL